METSIHMMRHGAVANPDNLRYGRIAGFRLSERGREQAEVAASYLRGLKAPIDEVVSSPLERAVETANIVRLALGLGGDMTIEDRLIEAANDFDGKSRLAVLMPWNWWRMYNPFEPSWGESFAKVGERMLAAIAAMRAARPGGNVLAVSHQSPIWIARQALESSGVPWRRPVRCAHASITTLRFEGDRYLGHTYWTAE